MLALLLQIHGYIAAADEIEWLVPIAHPIPKPVK